MRMYAVIMMAFSLLPGISFLSHAGGLLGGFVAGLVIPASPAGDRYDRAWTVAALVGVLIVLVAFYQVSVHGSDFLRHVE